MLPTSAHMYSLRSDPSSARQKYCESPRTPWHGYCPSVYLPPWCARSRCRWSKHMFLYLPFLSEGRK